MCILNCSTLREPRRVKCVSVLQLLKHTREALSQRLLSLAQIVHCLLSLAHPLSRIWCQDKVPLCHLHPSTPQTKRNQELLLLQGQWSYFNGLLTRSKAPAVFFRKSGRMVFPWLLICWVATVSAPALVLFRTPQWSASCGAAILFPFHLAVSTMLFIEVLLNRIVQSLMYLAHWCHRAPQRMYKLFWA